MANQNSSYFKFENKKVFNSKENTVRVDKQIKKPKLLSKYARTHNHIYISCNLLKIFANLRV